MGFCGNVVLGDIPAATAEDVELAVDAARKALARNKGRDWANASGAVRAKYLRAIAAKVSNFCYPIWIVLEIEDLDTVFCVVMPIVVDCLK